MNRLRRGKPLYCLAAAASLMTCVLPCPSLNAATELVVGKVTTAPDTTGTVPVTFNGDTAAVALQFDVSFDATSLTAGPPLLKDFTATHQIVSSMPGTGLQRIVVYSMNNTSLPAGATILLRFTPRAGLSEGTAINVGLAKAIVSSATGDRVTPVQLIPGSLTISTSGGGKAPRFDSITAADSGKVDFQLTGTAGQRYVIQTSIDLRDWKPLETFTIPAGGILKVNDPAGPQFRSRFYRAVSP